jgi:hypothetical protein
MTLETREELGLLKVGIVPLSWGVFGGEAAFRFDGAGLVHDERASFPAAGSAA